MMTGIVLIDKPAGLSSAQVVSRVKKTLHADKVGHAGTLDPMATGLLVCLLGKATKLAGFAEGGEKIYRGVIKLGIVTDTDDITGNIIQQSPVQVRDDEILSAVSKLTGAIDQIPPAVSAIKVDGERAYNRVRNGETVTLAARAVEVREFNVERISTDEINYRVRCSKGTYIRSLARDLGVLLGCGGTLATIRREGSKPFSVENAVKLESLAPEHVISWSVLFDEVPFVSLSGSELKRITHGDQLCVQSVMSTAARQDVRFAQGSGSGVPSLVLYRDASSGKNLGLFQRDGAHWALGIHLGE